MRDQLEQAQAILFGLALGDAQGECARATLALTERLLDAGLDADFDAQVRAIKRRLGDVQGVGLTLGYLYRDADRLREVARANAPEDQAASIAAAYAVKLALDGVPVAAYLPHIMAFTDGLSDEFDAAIYRIGHVGAWADEEAALDHVGQGWTGEQAVALALYCVIRCPDDYAACVRRAANSHGDSDLVAYIAGGIMGARLGLSAIPAEWIARCENRVYLNDLAARMADAVSARKG